MRVATKTRPARRVVTPGTLAHPTSPLQSLKRRKPEGLAVRSGFLHCWIPHLDLNQKRAVSKTTALPLSYEGKRGGRNLPVESLLGIKRQISPCVLDHTPGLPGLERVIITLERQVKPTGEQALPPLPEPQPRSNSNESPGR